MQKLYEQLKAGNCLEPRDNNQCQAERKKPTLPFIYYLLLLLQSISGFSFLVISISCILTVTLTALYLVQGKKETHEERKV